MKEGVENLTHIGQIEGKRDRETVTYLTRV